MGLHVEMSYLHRGSSEYFLGGQFVRLPTHRFTVFWAGLPHRIVELPSETALVRLRVPLLVMLSWNLGSSFLKVLLNGGMLADDESLPWDAGLARQWLDDLRLGDGHTASTVELELQARMRRLALQQCGKLNAQPSDERQQHQIVAMLSYVSEHFREELDPKGLAAALRLPKEYMTALFRRVCGMSVMEYLTRLRLSHAQMDLVNTDKTVLSIALDSGFDGVTRFYSSFERACAVAPGEYRKRAASRALQRALPASSA